MWGNAYFIFIHNMIELGLSKSEKSNRTNDFDLVRFEFFCFSGSFLKPKFNSSSVRLFYWKNELSDSNRIRNIITKIYSILKILYLKVRANIIFPFLFKKHSGNVGFWIWIYDVELWIKKKFIRYRNSDKIGTELNNAVWVQLEYIQEFGSVRFLKFRNFRFWIVWFSLILTRTVQMLSPR